MFEIEEYGIVHKGMKKDINEDNIYLNGFYLEENNDGLNNYTKKKTTSSKRKIYGVFDGISGLEKGNLAAYKATNLLSKIEKESLLDALKIINKQLYEIKTKEKIELGTTASVINLDKNNLVVAQIGDSAIYMLIDNEFIKLKGENNVGHLLNNYLGKNDFVSIKERKFKIRKNAKLIICSDGLTNSVSDDKISSLLASSNDIVYIANKLLNDALINKTSDNISIICLNVRKNYMKIILFYMLVILIILGILITIF